MKIYEDDKICIRMLKRNGKMELVIDYFNAGLWVGQMETSDLYNMNLVDISLSE